MSDVLVQKKPIRKNQVAIPCYCKVILKPDPLKPRRQAKAES